MYSDELEARLEQIEMSVDVANDLLIEKLAEFDRRINALEKEQHSEISAIRSELKELSSSSLHGDFAVLTSTPLGKGCPAMSPPVGTYLKESRPEPLIQAPITLSDVQGDLKEKIRNYVPNMLDPKERLTPAQYGYCQYWLSDRQPESGRKCHAVRLREDGVADGMWGPTWKPDIASDFDTYLLDKIKQHLKKQKKAAMKLSLKRKAESQDSVDK